MMKTKPSRGLALTRRFMIAFFAALVILPLVRMLLNLDAESLKAVFGAANFSTLVLNSLLASGLSTLIVLVLAYLLAVSLERSNIRCKGILNILLVLPMLIPSISHGMALVALFGNSGFFTKLFGWEQGIYGLVGIVTGSVMYAFPVAYLMIADVLKYQDCSPYEAAKVLGIPTWRRFTAITLPYLRKPLISVTLAVFTMVVTDYGVPLTVGGKFTTLPVALYREAVGQMQYGKGSVYGLLLLIPAVIGFLFDCLNKDKGNTGYLSSRPTLTKNRLRDGLAYLFCALVGIFAFLPIAVFSVMAFSKKYPSDISFTLKNMEEVFTRSAGDYLLNSVIIALFVALIGVLIACITAYFTARMKSAVSKLLHLFAITSAAIPGIVLGLSYILVFRGSILQGTLVLLIMVNTVHFMSSPYLMMYNSLSKVSENLEGVGATLGISRIRIIKDVILPQSLFTILEMFSYFFVNSMMTISAVSFLATTKNKPISLMINQFEAQNQLEATAVVALMILAVNLLMKGGILLLKKIIKRRAAKRAA